MNFSIYSMKFFIELVTIQHPMIVQRIVQLMKYVRGIKEIIQHYVYVNLCINVVVGMKKRMKNGRKNHRNWLVLHFFLIDLF